MNPNKTISVNSRGFIINFTDTNKHHYIKFENQDVPRTMPAKYQEIEKPVFNQVQQRIYAEALYGMNLYTEKEAQRLPKSKVVHIIDTYQKVQRIINRWKQEIVNDKVDDFLLSLFPKSPVVKAFTETKGADDTIKATASFKDLGIDQIKIANKLVEFGLLPQNFFNLR